MNITEAARILGVSHMTVYRLIAEGRLTKEPVHPLYRKHGPVRIPREQVERLKTEGYRSHVDHTP